MRRQATCAALGAVLIAGVSPAVTAGTTPVEIIGITNFQINCDPGAGDLENCLIAQGDQVTCPAGDIAEGVNVTVGPAFITTGVNAANDGSSTACYNIESVTHDFIQLRVPAATGLTALNGGAGSSGGSGIKLEPNQCDAEWPTDDIFRYIRSPGGTIANSDIVRTDRPALATQFFPAGSADFSVFYGAGTFDVELSATASESSQAPGTWDGGVFTDAGGEITVTPVCRTPEPPSLVCDFKTLNPTTLQGPDGVVSAAFRIRATNNLDPLPITVTDTMGAKMSYAVGTAVPVPSSTSPLEWTSVLPADPDLDDGADPTFEAEYSVQVSGLNVGETVCNQVVATGGGLTTNPADCEVCVRRPGTPPPVPAITPLGMAALGLGLAGLGGLVGFRRRG